MFTLTKRLMVLDNFLVAPEWHFSQVNPYDFRPVIADDGISYPGINPLVHGETYYQFRTRLEALFGPSLTIHKMFWRTISSEEPEAATYVHSDYGFGRYAAHVYFSRIWPEGSGTKFWRSLIDGSEEYSPTAPQAEKLMVASLSPEQWSLTHSVQGKLNRALIHDANLWHSAEPRGGFGSGPADGRLVLTCFFTDRLEEIKK